MIETAIIIAAGEGSRLRPAAPFKPLCPVGGKALIDHALDGLAAAGLSRAIVVLGYGADEIERHLAAIRPSIHVETVRSDYRKPNGTSVLAAQDLVAGKDALLAMCDHLVEPGLYRRMARRGAGRGARLAIDRRINSDLVDMDDVTRVQTRDDRIVAIGKGLEPFDCFDTGVFAISNALFGALCEIKAPSLTEGMRLLALDDQAFVEDCSDLGWIDVDDAWALGKAEEWLASQARIVAPAASSI